VIADIMRGTGRYNLAQGAIATVSLPKIIRAGADAAMGYLRAGMIDLLKLLGGFLVGLFRSQAAREAEMAFLRQQLLGLKRSAPARLRLRNADRLNSATFLCHVSVSSVKRSRHCFASPRWHPVLTPGAQERHEPS
jgi:hypothetical protein